MNRGGVREVFALAGFLALSLMTRFVEATPMKHSRRLPFQIMVILMMLLVSGVPLIFAQGRMSDKDLQSLMNSLQEDAKKFKSTFNSAVKNSPIRKTAQEKDAKALVEQFLKQTQDMSKQFKTNKKADPEFTSVRQTADQIDKLLATTPMGELTNNAWAKVKTELGTLSRQLLSASPKEVKAGTESKEP